MSIQVAQAVIRNNDIDNSYTAMNEIARAIRDGYKLCKVDEAIERIKAKTSDKAGDYQEGLNFGLMLAVKVIKEACE